MALEAVVVFTAGGEVEMERGDGALLLGFFGLGMDYWPVLISLSVSAVSGRFEEIHRVWIKPKRLPCGPRSM
uniref:Uncharacterized protein n=1 Tax=Oryza glumipatula TaxID=40148 RepID=A0A0D9YQM9_9ORYZ